MKPIRYIFAFAFAGMAVAQLSAQDINKEITIEKEIIPELRAATRLNLAPVTIRPVLSRTQLTFSELTSGVEIDPTFATLSAANTLPAIALSPYRGYASIGFFPAYNLGFSAGYNFIGTEKTTLNAWVQFDSYSYKTDYLDKEGKKESVLQHSGRFGMSFSHRFTPERVLSLNMGLGGSNVKNPVSPTPDSTDPLIGFESKKNNFRFNLDGRWTAGTMTEYYTIGAKAGVFNNSVPKDDPFYNINYPAVKESRYGFDLGGRYSFLGVDAELDFVHYNEFNRANGFDTDDGNGRTIGVVSVKPHLFYEYEMLNLRAGINLQYTSNYDKKFHIAPDIRLSVAPSSNFSAYINVGGGEHINSQEELFNLTPFINPTIAYGVSNIPYSVDLGIVAGPFRGFSIELFGGYAKANNWLMPGNNLSGYGNFEGVDIKGWHFGLKARYSYRDIVEVGGGFEMAPQKYDEGYYLWRDRAKEVFNIDLSVRPVKSLSLNAGFEMRNKRVVYIFENGGYIAESLGNIKNLSLGGTYSFTDQFSVFLRGENLLNGDWTLLGGVPAQGLTGLAGVSYKF